MLPQHTKEYSRESDETYKDDDGCRIHARYPMFATKGPRAEPRPFDDHKFIPAIEGLRACAVIMTCLDHVLPGSATFASQIGYTGVGLFFVLSGHLVTGVILRLQVCIRKITSASHCLLWFYADRFVRLAPALIFMVVSISCLHVFYNDGQLYDVSRAGFMAAAYLTNVESIAGAIAGRPFANTWSLACEEHFYLIWPFLLLLIQRLRYRQRALVFFLLITVSYLAKIYAYNHVGSQLGHWHKGSIANFYRLLAGAMLHLIPVPLWMSKRIGLIAATAGFALVILAAKSEWAALQIGGAEVSSMIYLDPIVVFSSYTILAFYTSKEMSSKLLEGQAVRFVGKVSYSLYLWQYPLMSLDHWPRNWRGIGNTSMAFCAAIFSTFVIEEPIRKVYRKWKAQM